MAVQTNTITTQDINFAIEVDFVKRYEESIKRLMQILGMFSLRPQRPDRLCAPSPSRVS